MSDHVLHDLSACLADLLVQCDQQMRALAESRQLLQHDPKDGEYEAWCQQLIGTLKEVLRKGDGIRDGSRECLERLQVFAMRH